MLTIFLRTTTPGTEEEIISAEYHFTCKAWQYVVLKAHVLHVPRFSVVMLCMHNTLILIEMLSSLFLQGSNS